MAGTVLYPTVGTDIRNIKASFKPPSKLIASSLWKSKPQPWSCKHTKNDHNYPLPDHEYFQPVWALRLQTLPSWSALLSQSNMLLTFMLYRLRPRHQQPPVCLSFTSHLYGSSLWAGILRDLFQSLPILGDCYKCFPEFVCYTSAVFMVFRHLKCPFFIFVCCNTLCNIKSPNSLIAMRAFAPDSFIFPCGFCTRHFFGSRPGLLFDHTLGKAKHT